MELKHYLRQDFSNYLRPLLKKHECEVCGTNTGHLHVHHVDHFQDLLDETLTELGLEFHNDIVAYSERELQFIRNIMLGKQARIEYVTCCEQCHLKLHDGSYRKRKHEELINVDEAMLKLQELVKKCEEDYYYFVGKTGLGEIANTLQFYEFRSYREGKSQKYFCSSVNAINGQLQQLELPYRIDKTVVSKSIAGKKKKFTYYTVVSKNEAQ